MRDAWKSSDDHRAWIQTANLHLNSDPPILTVSGSDTKADSSDWTCTLNLAHLLRELQRALERA
jgi:hypothetical protein